MVVVQLPPPPPTVPPSLTFSHQFTSNITFNLLFAFKTHPPTPNILCTPLLPPPQVPKTADNFVQLCKGGASHGP
jgi:hypothetical protein